MEIIETDWKWASPLADRPRTDYIALHHAEASVCTAEQIDEWHKSNGWSGIGYHFFVRKNGEIYRGRPLEKTGAHVSGMNSRSIGICAEGSYGAEIMPEAQKKAICELLVYLKDNYYPTASIAGHREIGDSDCPGGNFPLEEIKSNYRQIAEGASEYTDINDIVWELKSRQIISDSDLWVRYCENDSNIYWFCRKLCQYIRTKEPGETAADVYENPDEILWDLSYRGIISDTGLWEKYMAENADVYYLLKKGLHYCRTY